MEIIAGFLLLAGFAAQLAVICARPVSGLWGPWLVGAALLGLQAGLTKTSRLRLCRSLWLAWLGLTLLLLAMAGFRTGGVREWPDSGLECL